MPARPPSSRRRRAILPIACALALLTAAGGGLAWWKRRGAGAGASPARPLLIVISGDTAGWITPCGCTSNQSGGLPRRATFLDDAANLHEVLYADVGGAPAGASEYHRTRFAAILRGEALMRIAAHNLGAAEAALGAEALRDLAARTSVPFISANLQDAGGRPVAAPLRIVHAAGKRIAFAGVLSPSLCPPPMKAAPARESLLSVLAAAAGTYDALIVLAYCGPDELDALGRDLPEADAIIGGPTGQTVAAHRVGSAVVASATNKGKFLALLHPPPPAGDATGWSADVAELDARYADDPRQLGNVRDYLAELARRDFRADQTGLVPTAAPAAGRDSYRIAGSAACVACHRTAHEHWSSSRHAQAIESLKAKASHVDPACQLCHTTGYGVPGGFVSLADSAALLSVGCESCHGPSLAHARQPQTRTPFIARDQCSRCHDAENSPKFDYATYWPRIEHGRELASTREAPP